MTALLTLSPHVAAWETVCECGRCGRYKMSEEVLEIFEALRASVNRARREAGQPERGLAINSGVRCLARTERLIAEGVLTSRTSLHIPDENDIAHALDVAAPRDLLWSTFAKAAQVALAQFPKAGLGLYPARHIHIDDGYNRMPARRWTG